MAIGHIQIRTEPAQLGYKIGIGQLQLEQPRPEFQMKQPRADLHIEQPLGTVHVDSSRAWDALGVGGNLTMMSRIYSQAPDIARQAIAKIVADGNRMADITNPAEAIPELAQDWYGLTFPEFDTSGEASPNNVDVWYEPGNLVIDAHARPVEINTHVNRPDIRYIRGPKDMYMISYGKVEIIPPKIDLTAGD